MKNEKIKKERQEENLVCTNCGKGHLTITIIQMGNLDRIIKCDVCDFENRVRKEEK